MRFNGSCPDGTVEEGAATAGRPVICAAIGLARSRAGTDAFVRRPRRRPNGYYQLVARHSGKCLEGQRRADRRCGEAVRGMATQERATWNFELLPDGYYRSPPTQRQGAGRVRCLVERCGASHQFTADRR